MLWFGMDVRQLQRDRKKEITTSTIAIGNGCMLSTFLSKDKMLRSRCSSGTGVQFSC